MAVIRLWLCRSLLLAVGSALLTLAAVAAPVSDPLTTDITPATLQGWISTLSTAAPSPRQPGTEGEDRAINTLVAQFKALGLYPGSLDGHWTQPVELMGIQSEGRGSFKAGARVLPWQPVEDYILGSRRYRPDIEVQNAPLVFAGYGRRDAARGLDDFRGTDVAGKVLVLLAGPAPSDGRLEPLDADQPASQFAQAARLGAAAVLLIHAPHPSLPTWPQLQADAQGEVFDLDADDRNLSRVAIQGWMTAAKARELLRAAGQDLDVLRQQAASPHFTALPLRASASLRVRNTLRSIESRSVVARLAGRDPRLEAQHVLYTAPWDDRPGADPQDTIAGLAGLMTLAQAFQQLPQPPARSVLFLVPVAAAPESLGARQYARQPLFAAVNTLAAFDLGAPAAVTPAPGLEAVGSGQNTLQDLAENRAAALHLPLVADRQPERGDFYRGASGPLAQLGIPVWSLRPAPPQGDAGLATATQRLQLLFDLGRGLASGGAWPMWQPGSGFKAIREQPLE